MIFLISLPKGCQLAAAIACIATREIGAAGLRARGAGNGEAAAVEGQTQVYLKRCDFVTLEQIKGVLDLCQVGVCIQVGPVPLASNVLGAVEVGAPAVELVD